MSNLREELERKRREQPAPDVCVKAASTGPVAFLGFWPTPLEHVGFSTGQLLRFKLVTRKPDLADDPTKPPQTLTLSFPTDDVVITGKYLDEICRLLSKNELASVAALPGRHAELDPLKTFVTKIDIIPVSKA
jgi:hypothetical protein